MKIVTTHYVDSSHQLPDSPNLFTKKCAQLHGHTYKIVVTVDDENNRSGMVIDFGLIKDAVNIIDHKHINDIFEFQNFNEPPTAENIARFLFQHVSSFLKINVEQVAVCEGYKGDENSNWVYYP